MSSLVVHEGVHVFHGDILLKRTLASIASRCIGMAPPSNSSDSMRMVILGATKPVTSSCIVYVFISKHVLVTVHINL